MLRKAENVYYPPTIQVSVPSGSRIDIESKVAEVGKDSTTNVPTSFANPSRRLSSLGPLKKKRMQIREWPLMS